MMLRAILWVVLVYCLYKFIFDFLVPVFRVSRQMKQRVREFQDQVQQTQPQSSFKEPSPPPKEKAGDYIEFEEVKDK